MKKIFFVISMFVFSFSGISETTVDEYDLRMALRMPAVFSNTQSLGYRKYVMNSIRGALRVEYEDGMVKDLSVVDLENRSHQIDGENVTYDCCVSSRVYPRMGYVGNNKTGLFNTPFISFFIEAEPSYSTHTGEDEDNSLYVLLSGIGSTVTNGDIRIARYFSGYVAGQMGCGCKGYGHVSPTRTAGPYGATEHVVDVASVDGRWRAKIRKFGDRSLVITR